MHTVLIIEDDEGLNLLISIKLKSEKYKVLSALNAAQAYEILNNNPVQIAVVDYKLPDATGKEIAEFILSNCPETLFIVATGQGDERIAVEMMKMGAFDYLTKDHNFLNTISIVIDKAIENYNLKQDLLNAKLKNAESENLYKVLVEQLPEIIVIHDKSRILFINKACYNILGYTNEDLCGKSLLSLFPDTKIKFITGLIRGEIKKTVDTEIEIRSKLMQNKIFTFQSDNIKYKGQDATLTWLTDITERKKNQNILYNAIVKTQEDERKRFAEDLHDDLGPILSCIKLYSNLIISGEKTVEEKKDYSKALTSLVDNAINNTRAIAQNLMPNLLSDFGLTEALREFIKTINKTKSISIQFKSNLNIRIDETAEIVFYRVITELINNTLRHARATRITITIELTGHQLTIIYKDNGIGFKPQGNNSQTLGLKNIESRLKSIDAEVIILNKNGSTFIIKKNF